MIAAVFYALFIIVPLILTPWNFELFEFNKMLVVYAGAGIILGLWIVEMIRQKRLIFLRTPFDLPLLLFLASQILATVFSVDPHTSIWGYYSRFHGGLLSTISYLTLFWAYSTFMRSKTQKVVGVILSTGLVVSLYGIAERLGIDKTLWIQDVQNRVFSTLGQPNWLAAYLIMLIPLAADRPSSRWLMPFYFASLYFTRSRSGYLGFGVTLAVYCLMRWKKISLILLSLILVLLFLGRNQLPFFAPTAGLVNEAPLVGSGGSSSADIRRIVWRGALDIWHRYPLFGSGVETFAYTYYNFRPQEHNLLSEWDFLYNKAHNEFLNFLATTGIFGLSSYILLIVWFSVYAFREKQAALLAGYWGLAVSNFFGFAVVPVALFFFLWPALALPKEKEKPPVYHALNNVRAAAMGLILVFILYWLLLIIKLWRADYLFNLGRNQVKAKMLSEGTINLKLAVKLIPDEPVFRSDLAEAEAQMAYAYSSPSAALSRQYLDSAVKDADTVISQNPVNLNFWRSRVKIFLVLSELNPDYYNQVLTAFDRAIALAPTDAKLTYNLGLIYSQLGQTGLAEQMLYKTIEQKPNYEAARNSLGSLYEQTGRPELAKEQYEYVLQFLNPDNTVVKAKLEQL